MLAGAGQIWSNAYRFPFRLSTLLSQVFVDTGGGRMEPFEGYLERLTPPQGTKTLKEAVPAVV